jgi:hypothetical protein
MKQELLVVQAKLYELIDPEHDSAADWTLFAVHLFKMFVVIPHKVVITGNRINFRIQRQMQ